MTGIRESLKAFDTMVKRTQEMFVIAHPSAFDVARRRHPGAAIYFVGEDDEPYLVWSLQGGDQRRPVVDDV